MHLRFVHVRRNTVTKRAQKNLNNSQGVPYVARNSLLMLSSIAFVSFAKVHEYAHTTRSLLVNSTVIPHVSWFEARTERKTAQRSASSECIALRDVKACARSVLYLRIRRAPPPREDCLIGLVRLLYKLFD